MPSSLALGIYEHLVTRLLDRDITLATPALAELGTIDRADLPGWLSRHFARELEGVLRDARDEEAQLLIAHALLDRLTELAPKRETEDAKVAAPARVLLSLREAHRSAPLRPETPLTSTTLLTRARTVPALGHGARSGDRVGRLIVEQLRQRVVDPRSMRAIAFCVSVEHAEFMGKP